MPQFCLDSINLFNKTNSIDGSNDLNANIRKFVYEYLLDFPLPNLLKNLKVEHLKYVLLTPVIVGKYII